MSQERVVGGPYASVHIKTPLCRWRCPAMRGARRSSILLRTLFQIDNKAWGSFPLKVSDQQCFSHQMNASLSAPTLCFSVGPGYGSVPERWSTILLSVQKTSARPWKRRRGIFFLSFNHHPSPLLQTPTSITRLYLIINASTTFSLYKPTCYLYLCVRIKK